MLTTVLLFSFMQRRRQKLNGRSRRESVREAEYVTEHNTNEEEAEQMEQEQNTEEKEIKKEQNTEEKKELEENTEQNDLMSTPLSNIFFCI